MIRLKMNEFDPLERFSKFESVEDYQLHMELWMGKYKQVFSKSELVGFKWLMFFSEQIPGVCNTAIGTMLSTIHEDIYDHGISRTSFKRMINKATSLGILTVFETQRENGSQGSNLYVFNRLASSGQENVIEKQEE
ncbi:hypothetical protein [Bacillus sp. T3]|uniref:hypothetical protein n=1 Tax=Bacillus sp. T3 TaxID=467262 RepID=UPI002980E191|nr:hypothetical protein [Bacillus sp. T3]